MCRFFDLRNVFIEPTGDSFEIRFQWAGQLPEKDSRRNPFYYRKTVSTPYLLGHVTRDQFCCLTIQRSVLVHQNGTPRFAEKDEVAVRIAQRLNTISTNVVQRTFKRSYIFHLRVVPIHSSIPGEIVQMFTEYPHCFAQLVEKASVPISYLGPISNFLMTNRQRNLHPENT